MSSNLDKSKTVAGVLALFLGGLGIHKFYLGQTGTGVVFLLFCWTLVPAFIALFQGIGLLCMSETGFKKKYFFDEFLQERIEAGK